jgi:hypothetical protein
MVPVVRPPQAFLKDFKKAKVELKAYLGYKD